jgi:hypothetical protein
MSSVRIFPPLAALLWFAFSAVAVLAVLAAAVAAAAFGWLSSTASTITTGGAGMHLVKLAGAGACGMAVVLGLLLFFVCWLWAATVDSQTISGRTYWGRRVTMRWEAMTAVQMNRVSGLPAVTVKAQTGRTIWVYVSGLDLTVVHTRLCRVLGPEHAFTRMFEPPGLRRR